MLDCQTVGKGRRLLNKPGIFLRLVVCTFSQLTVYVVEMPLHRVDMRESLTHLFKQRSFVGKLHLLWKIADGCLGRDGDLPRRRTLQSGDDF